MSAKEQSNQTAASPQRSLPLALGWALVATLLATSLSYWVPALYSATAVGAGFFLLTYLLVLRRDAPVIRRFGLSLGGLLEPEPLNGLRLARAIASASGFALLAAAIVFPLFWFGFIAWWHPTRGFTSDWLGLLARVVYSDGLGQLFVIAFPEELFYRGYLQTALEQALPTRSAIDRSPLAPAIVVTSAIFAVGHLATDIDVARLAVFFPSLLFGWLRVRTGGVGASVAFHALCNLFASYLARGYALDS